MIFHRDLAQPGSAPALGAGGRRFKSCNPDWRYQMEAVMVEIRAAEGGDDAKQLVTEQFSVYAKLGVRRGL
jgi:hypothetical protein